MIDCDIFGAPLPPAPMVTATAASPAPEVLDLLTRIARAVEQIAEQTRPGSGLANGVVTLSAVTLARITVQSQPIRSIVIRALDTNSGVVVVSGPAGGRGVSHELPPGRDVALSGLGDLSQVYLWSEAANSVSWLAVLR